MDMGRLELSPSSTSASSSSSDHNKKAVWSPSSSSSPQPPQEAPRGAHQVPRDAAPGVPRRAPPGRRGPVGLRGARPGEPRRAAVARHLRRRRVRGARARRRDARPDSARLLAVPPPSALSGLDDARRAALEAVADFQRRFEAFAVDEVTSRVSAPPPLPDIVSGSAATSLEQVPVKADEPAALDVEAFEPDWFGDMDLDTYYASLAEGLLMEPPPPAAAWEHGDFGDGGADVALWSY